MRKSSNLLIKFNSFSLSLPLNPPINLSLKTSLNNNLSTINFFLTYFRTSELELIELSKGY